jgi:rod shape-determining protein MreD
VTGVFIGYGLGLLQDWLGHGYFGLHALGLAGAVLMFRSLDGFFNLAPRLREGLGVVLAVVGQWLSFLILTYWLRNNLVTVETLYTTFPLQMLFALLLYLPWRTLSSWFLGPLEDFSNFSSRLR